MNILIELSNFDINHVFFQETKRNVIIDGDFSKILYSTPDFVMNGLYLHYECRCRSFRVDDKWGASLKHTRHSFASLVEPQSTHKSVIEFDPYHEGNRSLVTSLFTLEERLVNHYMQVKSVHKYNPCNLKNQLLNGALRVNMSESFQWTPAVPLITVPLILKIAGIWETATQVGITYKFHVKEMDVPQLNRSMYQECGL